MFNSVDTMSTSGQTIIPRKTTLKIGLSIGNVLLGETSNCCISASGKPISSQLGLLERETLTLQL